MRTFFTRIFLFLVVLMTCEAAHATVDPANPHGPLSIACNSCHTTENWSKLRPDLAFDHGQTKFPLADRHTSVACVSCHTSLVFTEAGTNCRDCHLDIHRGQFAQNSCEECHTPAKWNNEEEMRTRHQKTRFPLIGVHAALDCQLCHANGQFVNVSVDCQGCHLSTYEHTATPSHVAGGLPTDCEQCHSIAAPKWAAVNFNHSMTAAACVACHRPDYEGTTDPNHVTGNYSQTCTECHSGFTSWRPATFNHDASGFPLTGAHTTVDCAQCHLNGQFAGTPTACYGCHQAHYEGVTDPNHVSGNFDHNCSLCHNDNAWSPATFDHSGTSFPLTGAHINADCAQCHINGQFNGTTSECYGCHQSNYEGVADPNHVAGNYDHNCVLCHSTDLWIPVTIDHNSTNFPLTGAHVNASCTQCHVNGQYQGTPTDCWSCHQADFEGVADPNHVSGNYDHACTTCHTTNGWTPATFDHSGTDFPLTGAHLSASCTQCHVNGQFQGTPTDCFFCHQNDYNGATNPNHLGAGFPTTCAECHGTSNWNSAWNHLQYFPIYSGRHAQTWDQCSDCHPNPNNYAQFTCLTCHSQQDTDPRHSEVPGYVFDSNACFTCHPTGEGGGLRHPRNAPHQD